MAVPVSFLVTLLMTPAIVKIAGNFSSPIKDELMVTQVNKSGTSSWGSLSIVAGVSTGVLLTGDVESIRLLVLTFPFFLTGFIDDMLKYRRHCSDGLSSLAKLSLQIVSSIPVALSVETELHPFLHYPVLILFTTATVNAVNITDGLDTLAVKSTLPSVLLAAIAIPSLRSANLVLLSVLAAFMIFNSRPARIFMGDGGSHFLGAFLALDTLLSPSRIGMFASLSLVYFELLTSLIQIISIRAFGRKVFLIAPFHHDLEQRGLGEEKIADIYFSVSAMLALFAAIFLFKVV